MKKLVLMLAAASMAASVSAQTVAESKTFDNIYVGINGGVATKTTGQTSLGVQQVLSFVLQTSACSVL